MNEQRWQPVILVLDKRLDCKCGALASFVTGKVVDNKYNSLEEVDVWCQPCFAKAQEEEEDAHD
jgi:hypothetical protein